MVPSYTNDELGRFAREQWRQARAWMRSNFPVLSDDDLGDIFQDAFLTLYDNILSGKLQELTSSLSVYFTGICKFKALEKLRERNKGWRNIRIDWLQGEILDDKIDEILLTIGDEATYTNEEETLVRRLVRNMPAPCNALLWGYYWDNIKLKALASQLGYTAGSIKVKALQCRERLRKRFNEITKRLHDRPRH